MALKKALPIVLLAASGGVAIVGYLDDVSYASIGTFCLAAIAVCLLVVLGTRGDTKDTLGRDLNPLRPTPPEPPPFDDGINLEFVEGYGITDTVTGMMNHLFFAGIIGTKVATARRRLWPVSIVLLHVNFSKEGTTREMENRSLAEFAKVIEFTLRDADVACRVSTRTFALVLDDTDEDGAAWAAERIQLSQARKSDTTISKVSAGIASYPSHGIEAAEILTRARDALERATSNSDLPGLGLVIVAPQRPI